MKRLPVMPRWLWIVNAALVLVLAAVGTTAVVEVRGSSTATVSGQRTTTVSRATVTAAVSASGNLAARRSVNVNFVNPGTVTDIYVSVGQRVAQGDQLAKVDDTKAKQSLASAQASLAQALASYATTTQGESSQQAARD